LIEKFQENFTRACDVMVFGLAQDKSLQSIAPNANRVCGMCQEREKANLTKLNNTYCEF